MQPAIVRLSQSSRVISLDDARAHLRLDAMDNDDYVQGLIDVAQAYVENRLGRTLTTTRYRMTLDKFPRRSGAYRNDSSPYYQMPTAYWDFALPLTAIPIELPNPPAVAVNSVSYTREDGTVVQMTAGVDYTVDLSALPPAIRPPYGKSWPQDCRLYPGSVTVDWVAGYGQPEAVPPQIRHAVKMLLTHYFENRSAVSDRTNAIVPESVDALLSSVSAGYYAQIR